MRAIKCTNGPKKIKAKKQSTSKLGLHVFVSYKEKKAKVVIESVYCVIMLETQTWTADQGSLNIMTRYTRLSKTVHTRGSRGNRGTGHFPNFEKLQIYRVS